MRRTREWSYRPIRRVRLTELLVILVAVVAAVVLLEFLGYRFVVHQHSMLLTAVSLVIVGLVVLALVILLVRAHFTGLGREARLNTTRGRGGRTMTVLAKDGTPLHVEVDGPEDAEVNVVLCHGWLADLTTWEAQRIGLADTQVRRVFYDHRGHGLSGWRGMDAKEQGVRELADDLAAVIDAAAPTGRLILIGHSMGGMTLMAFTQRHPEVLRERVDGVVLCATGASPLGSHMTLGLPSWMVPAHKVIRRYTLETLLLIGLLPLRIARILGIGPWLWGARLLACGPKAPEAAVVLTAGSIYRTPMRVGADCMHAVTCHDERESIASLHDVPTTVVVPGRDRLLPNPMQQELVELVDRVNDPKVIPVPDRGHMVMLEAPEVVNAELHRMIERSQDLLAQRRLAAPAPDPLVTSPSQT